MSAPLAPWRFAAIRLGAFVALAVFASGYWLSLLADPPVARACVALAAVAGGASLLAVIEWAGFEGWRRSGLAAAVLVAATVAALAAIGLPTSTLMPGGWDRLGAGIDRGLEGLGGDVDFPYGGDEAWSALILLAGLVSLLALASALTFWPRRASGSGPRVGGLATLIAIYAAAAAIRPGSEPLLAGLALLLLAAAWLWLPGLDPKAAVIITAVVAALGALALPVAGALQAPPWVDYRQWELAAPSDPRSFIWDHSYGPLAPRDGTPLLEVRSADRRYWRASVLDQFDGSVWRRSRTDVGQRDLELPTAVDRGSTVGAPKRLDPDWLVRTEFTLRELRSEFAIAPGALIAAEGIGLDPTPNGTAVVEDTLGEGDRYTALSYAPNPSADELRGAPDAYAPALTRHTTIEVPRIRSGVITPAPQRVVVPLGGGESARGERAARRLAASPYGDLFELARRLTAAAPTSYDAVKAIETHLQSSYRYAENVPPDPMPLRAFLFEHRAGYCERFAGAMALMLRMLGIPARVAAGFTPGSPDGPDRYLVRDLDAHSWVEVYFTGIGWVPFDPTPGAAPAELQVGAADAASAAGGGPVRGGPRAAAAAAAVPPRATAPRPSGGVPLWPFAIALGLPLAAALALAVARMLRHRSLSARDAARDGTRELSDALERLGWRPGPRITLSGLEEVLRSARRPNAAAYVAGLRTIRFGTEGRLPSLSERRRMRRELRRFPGWRAVLGSYLAIPPGGPRRLTGSSPDAR
jgi:transglutaminase-like putative cysteine protease